MTITIKQAIKTLKDGAEKAGEAHDFDFEDAQLLGIEALQFFKGAQREAGGYQELHLLGETEE